MFGLCTKYGRRQISYPKAERIVLSDPCGIIIEVLGEENERYRRGRFLRFPVSGRDAKWEQTLK